MPFIRTRAEAIAKAARDAQTKQDLETERIADYRGWAVDAWALTYERLIEIPTAGIGRSTRTVDVLSGATTVDLPIELRAFQGLMRSDMDPGMTPVHIDALAALQHQWIDGKALPPDWLQGAYYLEGGGVDGLGVTVARRLRILPAARSDMTITFIVVTQAPSFGDPTVPDDDAVAVDFQCADAWELTIAEIRARAASRGDQAEERRALGRWQESLRLTLGRMAPDQHRGIEVASMRRIGGGAGY